MKWKTDVSVRVRSILIVSVANSVFVSLNSKSSTQNRLDSKKTTHKSTSVRISVSVRSLTIVVGTSTVSLLTPINDRSGTKKKGKTDN